MKKMLTHDGRRIPHNDGLTPKNQNIHKSDNLKINHSKQCIYTMHDINLYSFDMFNTWNMLSKLGNAYKITKENFIFVFAFSFKMCPCSNFVIVFEKA